MDAVYVGTKIVTAWPQVKDGKEGYAVKYDDGYLSWSPKDVFDRCYRPMVASEKTLVCAGQMAKTP